MKTQLQKFLVFLQVPYGERETLSVLKNPDLQPIPPKHRIWGFWSNFAYWGILSFSMGTWISASGSLSLGLSVGEILLGYIIGDILTILLTLANSAPGTDWHVGYTLCQRVTFGVYGSGLGILIRVLLSIVNYGSNAWLGGLAVSLLLSSWSASYRDMPNTLSSSVNMTTRDFVGFVIFNVICCLCFFIRPFRMNKPLILSCIGSFFAMLGMVIYMVKEADGVGELFQTESQHHGSEKAWRIVYIITIWFSAVSPGTCSQADFARFASSKYKLWAGTTISLLIPTTIIPIFGIIGASCSKKLYNMEIWLPTDLVQYWLLENYSAKARAAGTFIALAFIFSQICFNVVTCGFAGGMDLAGILPKYINIRRGAVFTALVSVAVQPWNFYNSASNFLTVLSSFGVITTPIISIIVCDYFLIRKQKYAISQFFELRGDFYYTAGVNWRAIAAFVAGVGPGLPGMAWQVNPSYANNVGVIRFYYADSFFAFLISFSLYWVLAYFWPISISVVTDEIDMFDAFTEKERLKYGMIGRDEATSVKFVHMTDVDEKLSKREPSL
jgi:NCS1 family nucleobase:cation symporter-1